MSDDYLVQHALQNVWCAPRQDLQVIFRPARISRPVGLRYSITHGWSTIPLPTAGDLYHVYQIGQIEPSMLGLTPGRQVWRRLSEVMESELLIADVYTLQGRMLNRAQIWVIYTEERNLLVAVKEQPVIADLRTQPIYIRLYSNAYYSSYRSHQQSQAIICRSTVVTNTGSGSDFQNELNQIRQRPGATWFYHNGTYRDRVPLSRLRPGDILEYVYDSSVKQIIDLPLAGREVFESILDGKRKYLLHHDQPQVGGTMVDYQDDIDVYLVHPTVGDPQSGYDGCYYHKNNPDAFRQVTHRDYAIPSAYVEAYVNDYESWMDSDALQVRLFIRHAGFARPLVFENSRIQELYKLSDPAIVQAMVGTEALVDVWRAEQLENAAYVQIMRARPSAITRDLVEQAYGYNAVSSIMGNSPLPVEYVMGRRQVSLPYGQWQDSTMYEYDADGLLLGVYYHSAGPEYTPKHAECTLVEGIVGRGSYRVSTWFGHTPVTIDPRYNYRFYLTRFRSGVPDPTQWTDVTGDSTQYQIVNGQVVWLTDPNLYYPAVRSDQDFLAYEFEYDSHNSLIRFSIDAEADHPDGAAQGIFNIPVGKLDIWLNGHALIENLDYFVQWPQIVICNKKFLAEGTRQRITVRGTGFCESDLTRRAPAEVGFVQYGMLSRNRRFNLRDDKVIRLVIDGATRHRSVMEFAEDHAGILINDVPDGSPYVIEHVVVPLPHVSDRDDYEFIDSARQIDQQIENYLTLKLPEPQFPEPVQIPDRYELYSPFASVILHDLIDGRLGMDEFRGQYSDMKLKQRLEEYEYLLAYDPCFQDLDRRYVNVHPHNQIYEMEVDIYQHRFLARAVKIYLNDGVDLARFLRVKPF